MVLKDTNIFIWGDQLSATKVAAKFEETNSELFKIKTAHIDGEVASVEKVKALSKMPSRNELLAMLLQVWNAPIQNFTIGLNALKDKKERNQEPGVIILKNPSKTLKGKIIIWVILGAMALSFVAAFISIILKANGVI